MSHVIARRRMYVVSRAALPQLVLTQIATDNFNRADGAIGGANNWISFPSTPSPLGGTMNISSNQAVGRAAGSSIYGNYRSEAYSSNQYSQFTVKSASLASGDFCGLCVRKTATAGYHLLYFNQGGTYEIGIWKETAAGTYTEIGKCGNGVGALASGDVLRFIAEGSTLQALLNNVPLLAIVDTAVASGGAPGIEAFNNAVLIDDWVGGNAATGAVGAAIATDNFNRANNGMTVGQSNWAILTGYPAVDPPIVSNQLNPTTGSHVAVKRTDTFNADHWSAIQMGTSYGDTAGFQGVLTRVNSAGNSGYMGVLFHQGGGGLLGNPNASYRIYRLDSGVSTLLVGGASQDLSGNGNLNVNPTGTEYKLVSKGNRHSLRVNGSEVLAVTDSTYPIGQPGIMLYPVSTADNWSAGNV